MNQKIRQAYDDWAGSYDEQENKTRDLEKEVCRQVLGGRSFEHILELGCGTGKNTAFFSEISRKVTALDFSESMLDRACAIRGLENVTFMQADLRQTWPVRAESADLAAVNLVLEHIEILEPVFFKANRVLVAGGLFFISELHPFRQYQGVRAKIENSGEDREIPAFIHHISDFLKPASACGFSLESMNEWWHAQDAGKVPRLVTFLFKKFGDGS